MSSTERIIRPTDTVSGTNPQEGGFHWINRNGGKHWGGVEDCGDEWI